MRGKADLDASAGCETCAGVLTETVNDYRSTSQSIAMDASACPPELQVRAQGRRFVGEWRECLPTNGCRPGRGLARDGSAD
jgi:hypothetical protein